MNILNIVETAYRATLEEQDDTMLWLTHSLKNSGADVSVLLRGNAVNYAVRGQNAEGLVLGDRKLLNAPGLDKDLERLMSAKVPVFVVLEDMDERAAPQGKLVDGIEKIGRAAIPDLFDRFDQVWHW